MAEVLDSGAIIGWESASEIYVEEVVGVNVFDQSVLVTFAVNRVEPGKGVGAKSVRACVARVVMPFVTANAVIVALSEAGSAVRLETSPAANQERKPS
jgi:hypothetical protein